MKGADSPVLIFQRILPNYRRDVFRELSKHISVKIIYSDSQRNTYLPTANNLTSDFVKIGSLNLGINATTVIQNPIKQLIKYKPKVVICEASPSYLTLWVLLFLKIFFKYKLVLWGHGIRYRAANPYKGSRGIILKFLHLKADALLLYSEDRANTLRKFCKQKDKIFVANNTLNTNRLRNILSSVENDNLNAFKEEMNYTHSYNLIYVGRLLEDKGIDILLSVHKKLAENLDVGLHIIGEGPMKTEIVEFSGNYQKVYYHGPVYDEFILGKHIICSDLFVNIGYVGLSIVHAFCFKCPFITTEEPEHSPEIVYLQHNINGLILLQDESVIVNGISGLLKNKDRLKQMKANCLNTVSENGSAGIENFINGFKNVIQFVTL